MVWKIGLCVKTVLSVRFIFEKYYYIRFKLPTAVNFSIKIKNYALKKNLIFFFSRKFFHYFKNNIELKKFWMA